MRNPVTLLAVVAAGFAGWTAFEATRTPAPPSAAVGPGDVPPPEVLLPSKLLSTVQPGMPRPVVEDHLRALPPGDVESVDYTSGSPLYRVRYHVYLLHPLPQVEFPESFRPGPHVVVLTFDGQRPGHPLANLSAVPESP
jgi:hypothetical protein